MSHHTLLLHVINSALHAVTVHNSLCGYIVVALQSLAGKHWFDSAVQLAALESGDDSAFSEAQHRNPSTSPLHKVGTLCKVCVLCVVQSAECTVHNPIQSKHWHQHPASAAPLLIRPPMHHLQL